MKKIVLLWARLIGSLRAFGQPEGKMKLFVDAVLHELTAHDIDRQINGCIGCGNCGHFCPLYLTTNDGKHHPKIKSDFLRMIFWRYCTLMGRILGKWRLIYTPTDEDLMKRTALYFGEEGCCTICTRCSLACPQGLNPGRLAWLTRAGLSAAGVVPKLIADIRANAVEHGNSFGSDWEHSMGRALQDAKDYGIEVPLDRRGAKWLLPCSAVGTFYHWNMFHIVAEVLKAAGIDYTCSSRIRDTGTEAWTVLVDLLLARKFATELAEEARRLGCRGVLIGECACDVRIYTIEAAEIFRERGLEVVYMDALLLDKARTGELLLKRTEGSATLHYPCWSVRKAGYGETIRELLGFCITEIVEMTSDPRENYCCGGGAGAMRMWPADRPGRNIRREVARLKAEQIRATGVNLVVTPCATCVRSLQDALEFWGVSASAIMLIQMVYEAMHNAQRAAEQRKRIVAEGTAAIT
jgi:Fe-S oxidoreductase